MSQIVMDKLDQLINEENEDIFKKIMSELDILIQQLDCPYSRGFFAAIKAMLEGSGIKEKKRIVTRYKEIYQDCSVNF